MEYYEEEIKIIYKKVLEENTIILEGKVRFIKKSSIFNEFM